MNKDNIITKCVYCGEEKKTNRDHVVSKNLFPKSYQKKNPIIVPSCDKCNKNFSLDEEYFRIFLVNLAQEHSQYAQDLFFSKIKRSIQRRPQIGYKVFKQMDLVDFYTKSGIYMGKRTRIYITKDDRKRYFNILDKYIKGIFFYEFKEILPSEYKIKHFWGSEEMLDNFKYINKWNMDNKEIFAYGYSFIPNTFRSIWAIIFYNSIFSISFVATEEDFKQFDKPKL